MKQTVVTQRRRTIKVREIRKPDRQGDFFFIAGGSGRGAPRSRYARRCQRFSCFSGFLCSDQSDASLLHLVERDSVSRGLRLQSPFTDHHGYHGGVGRGYGVGRGLGVGPHLPVQGVGVGVGVGVGPVCAQYFPPVFNSPIRPTPPQTII